MTQEGLIHDREFNATNQRAPKTRRALRFVCTATGELEVVQEQFHRHQPLPVEEICQFLQAVRWKDKATNSCFLAEKLPSRLHNSSQGIRELFEDYCFHEGQILLKHLCIYVHGCIVGGKCPDWRETRIRSRRRLHVSCSRNNMSSSLFVDTCWIKDMKLSPDVGLR